MLVEHTGRANRGNRLRVVAQKRPPALGGRAPSADHVLRHRRPGELKPKLEQFTMDAGSAPQRVLSAHPSDQITQLAINPRPPCPLSRFPAPVTPEARPMPPQDRRRFNDLGHTEQARPQPGPSSEVIASVRSLRSSSTALPRKNFGRSIDGAGAW